MFPWDALAYAISAASGRPFRLAAQRGAGGGCINSAWVVEGSDGSRWFVKGNHANALAMFEAEAAGLAELAHADALRIPRPLCHGAAQEYAWLVLEYVEFGDGGGNVGALLGERLAALHKTGAARFGWSRDNTIGATPQPNAWEDDWVTFWQRHRLGHQLNLARDGGARRLADAGERLIERVPAFFAGYAVPPSLLHGDLWGGNWSADTRGEPVIFDPAVYYGDREADLAMTELFGGFPERFYAAYRAAWPLDPGYPTRRTLYNLYHVLNHFNLFGGGYQAQAERMIAELLAAVR